jgi:hypothetical protein
MTLHRVGDLSGLFTSGKALDADDARVFVTAIVHQFTKVLV